MQAVFRITICGILCLNSRLTSPAFAQFQRSLLPNPY